jgi:catechol 2,3-dioxygenase-like lactoylglutathione lyase family enzyme
MSPYIDANEQLVVEIFVRDIKRSTEFYRQLGFELVRDAGTFVELRWENHLLFLDEQKHLPVPSDFPQANMRVMVPNVDDYWQLANQLGARTINPISDRDYGLRDFTITDPDGFGVRFASEL